MCRMAAIGLDKERGIANLPVDFWGKFSAATHTLEVMQRFEILTMGKRARVLFSK